VPGAAARLPYVPGSQKLVPLSSASEADDVSESMPAPRSIATADDRNAGFLGRTIALDPRELTLLM